MSTVDLRRAEELLDDQQELSSSLSVFSGTLTEILCDGAGLSVVASIIHQFQQHKEPAAWVSAGDSVFFPPDFASCGIDLSHLPVVFAGTGHKAARAAEHLLRSGAFALVLLDLGNDRTLTDAHFGRLIRLGEKHDAAIICLTTAIVSHGRRRPAGGGGTSAAQGAARSYGAAGSAGSALSGGTSGRAGAGNANAGAVGVRAAGLGSLVTRRFSTRRTRIAQDLYRVQVHVVKDKRGGMSWNYEEVFHAPDAFA